MEPQSNFIEQLADVCRYMPFVYLIAVIVVVFYFSKPSF